MHFSRKKWKKWLLATTLLLPVFGESVAVEEMSLKEKVGQLFVLPVSPFRTEDGHIEQVLEIIRNYHIGGLIVKQGSVEEHVECVRKIRESVPKDSRKTVVELTLMRDAEWGLPMQLSGGVAFPRNHVLGQIGSTDLIEKVGAQIGEDLTHLGVHLNLAPVVDVNPEEGLGVIGTRAFGSDPEKVAKYGKAYLSGVNRGGALGCLKHFPGHGGANLDSHYALPTVHHGIEREMQPFKELISRAENGGENLFVMSAHIIARELDPLFPASLSRKVVQEQLIEKLGFKGLVITDALNMRAIKANYTVAEAAKRAFDAGHHFLLYGAHRIEDVDAILIDDFPAAYKALYEAFRDGELSEQMLNERVKKILLFKQQQVRQLPIKPLNIQKAEQLKREVLNKTL